MGPSRTIYLVLLHALIIAPIAVVPEALASYSQKRVHPASRHLPKVSEPAHTIGAPDDVRTIGNDYFASLVLGDSVTIGVDEGERHEMLGHIADITVAPEGRIFLLDSEFNEVLIYNSDGSYFGSFGGSGRGPGEFTEPRVVTLADSGRIAVVFDGRKQVFERQEDGNYVYRSSFRAVGRYGCAMNGHIYIARYDPVKAATIHKYTLDGKLIASFGHPYESDNALVASEFSNGGRITCSEKHGVLGFVLKRIPILYAYSEDGTFLWHVRFERIESPQVHELRGGSRVTYKPPSLGQGYLVRMVADTEGYFNLVYSVEVEAGKRTPWHYFRVDALTGEGEFLGNAPLIRAIHPDFVVQSWDLPYPVVRLIRTETE